MSNQSYLGLPPVPTDLKSITPYLQRADELKVQDPVVAYWCAYYAAQQGISLKALGPANRTFLSSLLTALENLRATIGPSEAINVESVAGVYVEDFALRVFNVADNEDRNGKANRSTAKKFLAAATFLEVMKVFEDKQLWESHADKVRYAKWKAADIAKALREGRAPTAGPAGVDAITPPEMTPSQSFPHMPSPAPSASTVPTLPPPPPEMSPSAAAAQDDRYNTVRRAAESSQTSSTQARAGYSSSTLSNNTATGRPSQASMSSTTMVGSSLSTVGEEGGHVASGAPPSPPSSAGSGSSRRRQRAGSVASPPPVNTGATHTRNRTSSMSSVSSRSPGRTGSPTHFVPRDSPPSTQLFIAANSPSVTNSAQGASGTPASLGPSAPPSAISPTGLPVPPAQSFPVPVAPPYISAQSAPHYAYAPPPPPPPPPAQPSPPPELSPSVIAKAQKHCRFAISALDYEDAEQARKELRSALALLGG